MSQIFSIEVWMVALAATVVVLAGFGMFARWCSFSPAVPRRKLERLRVGMTMDEVTALLREPRERKVSSDGAQQWLYGARMKRHLLMIEFNASNVLQSFAHGVPAPRRSARKDA
ncbi:MAG TPA: hypothetical protein VK846_17290 [Candidatus Limnocylindria bacterium]|nr:hypothetical protein [Candidatus Limnocylindria bacterium]